MLWKIFSLAAGLGSIPSSQVPPGRLVLFLPLTGPTRDVSVYSSEALEVWFLFLCFGVPFFALIVFKVIMCLALVPGRTVLLFPLACHSTHFLRSPPLPSTRRRNTASNFPFFEVLWASGWSFDTTASSRLLGFFPFALVRRATFRPPSPPSFLATNLHFFLLLFRPACVFVLSPSLGFVLLFRRDSSPTAGQPTRVAVLGQRTCFSHDFGPLSLFCFITTCCRLLRLAPYEFLGFHLIVC